MSFLKAIFLGIIQGTTEFLPISSSGHLVLIEKLFEFFGDSDFGLDFDIVLHLGTLFAILVYFRKDWLKIIKNLFQKKGLFGYLVLATLPTAIAGIFFKNLISSIFRNIFFVAIFFIITGCYFIFCEKFYKKIKPKTLEKLTFYDAFFIGVIQLFALFPGISRAGSTIGAGMLRGIKREEATRFSFLMGGIIIAGATFFSIIDDLKNNNKIFNNLFFESIFGFFFSAIFGYFSIAFLIKFLKNHYLYGFAMYLIISGIGLLIIKLCQNLF